jgi:phospholipid/cholesterol/gamma-HCH transport system substrate-binding protein
VEEKSLYIRIGAITFSLIFAAVIFTLWVHQKQGNEEIVPYDIYFKESVSGLSVASPVKFKGIPVGRVRELHIDKDPECIRVRIEVSQEVPIRQGTVASLQVQGVTGEAFIQISGTEPHALPLNPVKGQKVAVIPSIPSSLEKVLHTVPELLEKANDLLEKAQLIFDEKNQKNFSSLLENASRVAQRLNQQGPNIEKSLENLSLFFKEARQSLKSFDKSSQKVTQSIAGLSRQGKSVLKELQDIMKENRLSIHQFFTFGFSDLTTLVLEASSTLSRMSDFLESVEDELRYVLPINKQGTYRLK